MNKAKTINNKTSKSTNAKPQKINKTNNKNINVNNTKSNNKIKFNNIKSESSVYDLLKQDLDEKEILNNLITVSPHKHPKSAVMEYIQKHKMPQIKFVHTRFDRTQEFVSKAIFCGTEFAARAKNKKECERRICEEILEYLKTSEFGKKFVYKPPKEYKSILFIDLENFSSIKYNILKNYKQFKIVAYLSYAHTLLKTRRNHIKKFTELITVNSGLKDAVDLQITIDLARIEPELKKRKIERVYLLTSDHFGEVIEELLPYCRCINDPEILLDMNNEILN